MQTGVIDGYEHDANTTLHQRFYEVAKYMARTGHIAGVLGLFASSAGLARLSPGVRETLEASAVAAASYQRAMGPGEDAASTRELVSRGMTMREIDVGVFQHEAARLWDTEGRALGVLPWLEAIRA